MHFTNIASSYWARQEMQKWTLCLCINKIMIVITIHFLFLSRCHGDHGKVLW